MMQDRSRTSLALVPRSIPRSDCLSSPACFAWEVLRRSAGYRPDSAIRVRALGRRGSAVEIIRPQLPAPPDDILFRGRR